MTPFHARLLALVFLFLIPLSAVAQLIVGPERLLGHLLSAGTGNAQFLGQLAWNGDSGLVVWTEARGNSMVILGSRLAADGASIDPNGLQLVTLPAQNNQPLSVSVARNNDGYLLVWATPTTIFSSLMHLDAAGGVTLDHPEGVVAALGTNIRNVRLATTGSRFLAVYEEAWTTTGPTATAELLDTAGTPLLSMPIDRTSLGQTRVASNISGFAVATVDAALGITMTFLKTDGTITGKVEIPASQSPALTSIGSSYLVIWYHDGKVYDTMVSPDAVVLATRLLVGTPIDFQTADVALNGNDGLAVYSVITQTGCSRCIPSQSLYGIRFHLDGEAIDTPFLITNDTMANANPRVTWSGTSFVVAYEWAGNSFDYAPQIRSIAVNAANAVGPARPVLQAFASQSGPAASNGRRLLAATMETEDASRRLFVEGHELLNANPATAVIASDGEGWMVAWSDSALGTHASFYDRDTNLLGDTTLPMSTSTALAAAFDGTEYVVVGDDGWSINAVRLQREGGLLDSTPIVLLPRSDRPLPDATATVTGYGGRAIISIATNAACTCSTLRSWILSAGSLTASSSLPAPTASGMDSTNDGTDAYVVADSGQVFRVDGTSAEATLIANNAAQAVRGILPTIARLGDGFLIVWPSDVQLLSKQGVLEESNLVIPRLARLVRNPDESAAAVTYTVTDYDPPYNGSVLLVMRALTPTTRLRISAH